MFTPSGWLFAAEVKKAGVVIKFAAMSAVDVTLAIVFSVTE
jgi:hypothetical protein